jgi:steroid 5-alpha reductase family enzyme
MKKRHFIDTHKGATFLFVILMMAIYNQWENQTLWIYLALHGTYGLLWILKSKFFPDTQWEQPSNLVFGLIIWGGLSLYWVAPWLLASRSIVAPPYYLVLCVSIYSIGVFLHFVADMQKFTALTSHPNHLITEGLWSFTRNPNYLGELLIYASFALLSMHWIPILVLLAWIILVWIPNMLKKDQSLARYPEFSSYKRRSRLFIPFLF